MIGKPEHLQQFPITKKCFTLFPTASYRTLLWVSCFEVRDTGDYRDLCKYLFCSGVITCKSKIRVAEKIQFCISAILRSQPKCYFLNAAFLAIFFVQAFQANTQFICTHLRKIEITSYILQGYTPTNNNNKTGFVLCHFSKHIDVFAI